MKYLSSYDLNKYYDKYYNKDIVYNKNVIEWFVLGKD